MNMLKPHVVCAFSSTGRCLITAHHIESREVFGRLSPGMEDYVEKLESEPSPQPSASLEQSVQTWTPSLTWERGKASRGERRPSCSLTVCFWTAGVPKEGQFHAAVVLFAIAGASVSASASARQEKGHIQNQMHFHFLEKTILLVISVYLKYFSIIITKGASGHRATDRVRDVSPQATWDRLKRNFYNFENISLLFPFVWVQIILFS